MFRGHGRPNCRDGWPTEEQRGTEKLRAFREKGQHVGDGQAGRQGSLVEWLNSGELSSKRWLDKTLGL